MALDIWTKIKEWAIAVWDGPTGIKARAITVWTNISDWAHTKWDLLLEKAKAIWTSIKNWAKDVWTQIIDNFIEKWNARVPAILDVKIPGGSSGGGGASGVYTAPTSGTTTNKTPAPTPTAKTPKGYRLIGGTAVPYYAKGGIVTKDQLARIGEKGPEAVVPLNERSLSPLANMIASLIGNNTNSNQNIASDYVLVPIDKRELERELYAIRKQESYRIAGRAI